jgi:SAM-dependent methyltransferase
MNNIIYKLSECPLCASRNLKDVDSSLRNTSEYKPILCNDCSLIFLDKLYFTNQEKLDNFYQSEYLKEYYKDGKDNILFNFKNKMPYQEIRKERIGDYLQNDSTVLEVGCGPGYFLESIRKNVAKVVGVEKNNEERNFVKNHLKISCYKNYTTINEKYDVIVLNQVLEHIYSPSLFLRKLASNLNETGVIVIEVPSATNPLVALYNNFSFTNFWFQEPHLWYFNKETLQLTLEKALGKNCVEKIGFFQETSFLNHYNWVLHNKKSPSREQATSNSFPLSNIKNLSLSNDLEKLFIDFNISYKKLLHNAGYGDTMLAIVRLNTN